MTTEYLLDTNACIAIRDLLANKKIKPAQKEKLDRIKARWSAVPAKQLALSVITLGELNYGAQKASNPATAQSRLDALTQRVTVLDLDRDTTTHYGDIRAQLVNAPIGPNDTWIAAHGRRCGRTVVTNNLREFQRVPGLKVEDWSA